MPLILEALLAIIALWAGSHVLHALRGRPMTAIDGPIRSWLRRGRQEVSQNATNVATLLVSGIRHDYYRRRARLLTRRRRAGTGLQKAEPKLERRDKEHERGLGHLGVLYARVRQMPELAHAAPKWLKCAAAAAFAIDLVMFS